MKDNGYRKVMLQKTDEELLEIILNKRDDYQEKAILDIEAILTERGIDFNTLKNKNEELEKELISNIKYPLIDNSEDDADEYYPKNKLKAGSAVKKEQYPFGPMLVGIIMVMFAFVNTGIEMSYDDALTINLLANIGIRLIVLLWTLELVKKYQLNKVVWVILGLLFGGWQLIAINIAIWVVPEGDSVKK